MTTPPAPPTDAAEGAARERLIRERLNFQLQTLGRATQTGAFLAAVLLWSIFLLLTREPLVLAWAAQMHAVQAVRAALLRRTARDYPPARHPDTLPSRAVGHVIPMLVLASIAWGLSAWLLIPPGSAHDAQAPILVVILFGMMAASIPAIMPLPGAVLAWLAPIALLLAARFAWMGGPQGWIIGAGALLFGATMGRFAMAQHRLQVASLRTQLEKEALTDQLVARTRELQRLNQERSRFFASASHDLRQPVHALALFSRALQRDLEGQPARAVADRVVQATDAVSGLLNAMLDISKIDAGAVVPRPSEVAIDQLFLRLAHLFESRASEAGIALRFHTGPEVLTTDSELVLRVLANFVDNAIKYSACGGILISARARGPKVRLAVWDTGRGIAADHLELVFDEFYQVDNPHRDVARGLGIGLAIARRLARLVGGEVGVCSRLGRGSVFWLDLPRHAALPAPATESAPLAAAPAAGHAPPRVLLLDDEAPVGEAIRLWLAPYCARIEITQSVAAARRQVMGSPEGFDAFIVDFRLADQQNGIEATAELRQLAGRKVPTILVTGDTDPARVRAAYASGLEVMFKPVQPELLLRTLRALIAQEAARSE
ncbi:ATP-binding protein [Ottowia sp.]|uniref:hybrid sensor histidine kinase/response regulator n=1 Tax=Ottowia sp. TaxID=1898956 RepID=UPI0039E34F66